MCSSALYLLGVRVVLSFSSFSGFALQSGIEGRGNSRGVEKVSA